MRPAYMNSCYYLTLTKLRMNLGKDEIGLPDARLQKLRFSSKNFFFCPIVLVVKYDHATFKRINVLNKFHGL